MNVNIMVQYFRLHCCQTILLNFAPQLLTANLALASPILTFSFPFLPIYPFLCLKKENICMLKLHEKLYAAFM